MPARPGGHVIRKGSPPRRGQRGQARAGNRLPPRGRGRACTCASACACVRSSRGYGQRREPGNVLVNTSTRSGIEAVGKTASRAMDRFLTAMDAAMDTVDAAVNAAAAVVGVGAVPAPIIAAIQCAAAALRASLARSQTAHKGEIRNGIVPRRGCCGRRGAMHTAVATVETGTAGWRTWAAGAWGSRAHVDRGGAAER